MNVMLSVAINPKMSSTYKDSIFQIRIPLFVLFIYKTRINKKEFCKETNKKDLICPLHIQNKDK